MFFHVLPSSDGVRDLVATGITFALSLLWLRLMDLLAARGVLAPRTSRKVIHIGTGPLFVLCWLLFSPSGWARWLAALVPLAITLQFALVGLGKLKDEQAVQAMTRTGDRREILRGPLYYGLVFIVCTLAFWRTVPVGIVALMILCGGDGLADLVGRRFGRRRLPYNREKSWAGSAGMFVGGFTLALALTLVFESAGVFAAPLPPQTAGLIGVIALAATLVESLPMRDIDNLTISAVSVALGLIFF
jgi:phytol kinase